MCWFIGIYKKTKDEIKFVFDEKEREKLNYHYYYYYFVIDNGMDKHNLVIHDLLNDYFVFDWTFLEYVHVLNDYNQHVVHVEVDFHFDPLIK